MAAMPASIIFAAGGPVFAGVWNDVVGNYDVGDIFGEVSIPVLGGKPFAEELTFDAAVRISNYSTVGTTTTWKAGTIWAPVEDLRFRGSFAVAVRAPNIDELFSPAQGAFFRPIDPCDQDEINALIAVGDPLASVREANCRAAGIPAGYSDPLTARFVGETAGNPNLEEEEAETITVGFIFQPEFLSGLTMTVDYWDITIDDAIDAPSGQDIVDGCYDSANFPDNQFCPLIRRNNDPASPQFNGLTFIRQQQLNIGKLEAAGIDFVTRYDFDFAAFDASIGVSGTYMDKLDRFFDPTDTSAVDPELGELQRPELAGAVNLSISQDNWAVIFNSMYQDEQALRDVEIETANVLFGPNGFSDDIWVHDISFRWNVNDQYQLYGGVNNLSDEEPFLTEQAYPVSPIGRYFFVGLNAIFD